MVVVLREGEGGGWGAHQQEAPELEHHAGDGGEDPQPKQRDLRQRRQGVSEHLTGGPAIPLPRDPTSSSFPLVECHGISPGEGRRVARTSSYDRLWFFFHQNSPVWAITMQICAAAQAQAQPG